MKALTLFQIGACLLGLQGCGDTTFIGEEYPLRDSEDTHSDSETSLGTETNGDSETETVIDTETVVDTAIPTDTDTADSDTGTGPEVCGLPADFQWTSSEPLIFPPSGLESIKDPTVVYDGNEWLIYATTIADPLTLTYLSFKEWSEAGSAEQTAMNTNGSFTEYIAAPQLFYFTQHDLWYLVFQTQDPSYSYTTDPKDVRSWSPPTRFMPMPSFLTDNDKLGIDYWVICDDTDCYLFFSALDGVLYRARTAKDDFPEGFGGTIEVMQDDQYALYDASNVYKLAGEDQYLLLVSGILDGARYYRSWTADRLDGDWSPYPTADNNVFASINNVTGAEWSGFGLSHGEMLRRKPDETMTIDTCDMQYLFSGLYSETTDNTYYALGLLTDPRRNP